MTSPVTEISVSCPDCGHDYVDWCRPSINLTLDDFDDDYLEQATTTTCPKCGAKHDLEVLTVRSDDEGRTVFEM
ncbi:MAG: hypothetical protein F4Z04_06405 [Acidobacteria bacterium]|nr:hypothetical protein [Acidobacteriota bacterium]